MNIPHASRLFTLLATLALFLSPSVRAQAAAEVLRFADPSGPLDVSAEVVWGTIQVSGHSGDEVRLRVMHTSEGGTAQRVENIEEYVEIESQGSRQRIVGRTPPEGAFESIDLVLEIPARADLQTRVSRGGEIEIEGVDGLVNVSHRNGSVVLRDLGGAALVNAVNGSIAASFREVPQQALSFITLNGEVDLLLPAATRGTVHLRTERNGYVESDFELPGVDYPYAAEAREGSAKPRYSPRPIEVHAPINGGGPPIVATTENGPIRLRTR